VAEGSILMLEHHSLSFNLNCIVLLLLQLLVVIACQRQHFSVMQSALLLQQFHSFAYTSLTHWYYVNRTELIIM